MNQQDNTAQDNIDDEQIIASWYQFAADQPGFVGRALGLLREREGKTPQQQQSEFGINDDDFCRLQGMTMPRLQVIAADAHRMAEVCHVANQMAFVKAIILAHHLASAGNLSSLQEANAQQVYQAAYDAVDDLDTIGDDD